jgi:hypothetical protein
MSAETLPLKGCRALRYVFQDPVLHNRSDRSLAKLEFLGIFEDL